MRVAYCVLRVRQHASRITYHVSRITYHASRITFHVSRFTLRSTRLSYDQLRSDLQSFLIVTVRLDDAEQESHHHLAQVVAGHAHRGERGRHERGRRLREAVLIETSALRATPRMVTDVRLLWLRCC